MTSGDIIKVGRFVMISGVDLVVGKCNLGKANFRCSTSSSGPDYLFYSKIKDDSSSIGSI